MLNTKRRVNLLTLTTLVLLLVACAPASEEETEVAEAAPAVAELTTAWEVVAGVDAPESVYADAESGFIFVSQIGGAADARDGNGRIMQLSGAGEVLDEDWFTGLNAPKGLRSHEGVLWTADIDEVVGIDIATAEVVSRVTVEGAQFLNDVAVGEDGTVYVSDTFGTRIYALHDGEFEVFAEGQELEYPNGLLVEGNRLIVGAWGEPAEDFSTEVPGRLYSLDLATREKELITPDPFANIDGVEVDGRGGYVVSDFLAGKVMQVDADGTVRELVTFGPGVADIAFVATSGLAIVPHMQENRVAAYDVSGRLQ